MGYNDRNSCDGCICKFCKNNKSCNENDKRCNRCRERKFRQILYDHLSCEEFNKNIHKEEKYRENIINKSKETIKREEKIRKEAEQREIENRKRNKGKRQKGNGDGKNG